MSETFSELETLMHKHCKVFPILNFKDTLMALEDFKNKQKVYEVMFFDTWKYVYSESVFNTLYIEIKHQC